MTHVSQPIVNTEALRNDPPDTAWKVEARCKDSRGKISNIAQAIRELRAHRNLPLKEAKDTVEAYASLVMTGEPYEARKVTTRTLPLPSGGNLRLVTEDGKVNISFNFEFGDFAVENELDAVVVLSHRLASLTRTLRQYKAKA